MISLLIADDEGFVRNGLIKNLDWGKLGVDCVEQAADGLIALEKALVMKPEILVTDVRMPRMDGIELATKLREIQPNCKIIFMSGYSDKEYLKSALHLKAVSYIEKPINLSEITQVIAEAVFMCIDEEKKHVLELKKETHLKESLDMLKVNLPLEFLQNHPDTQHMEKWLQVTNINLSLDSKLDVIIFNFGVKDWASLTAKGCGKANAQEFIHEYLLSNEIQSVSSFKKPDIMVLIAFSTLSSGNDFTEQLIENTINRLMQILRENYPIFIGIGTIVDGMQKIPIAYQSAVIASQKLFFTGYGHYSHSDINTSQIIELNEPLLDSFKGLLLSKDKDKILTFLKDTARSIKACSNTLIPNIKSFYFKMLMLLMNHASRQKIVFAETSSESSLWETLSDFTTLDEVETFFFNFITAYFTGIGKLEGVSRCISDIYEIIERNYGNHNLSIQFICDKLYLSHSYLCVLFKKETGKTVNQYITEYRIEKAKELLEDSTVKLYYVASEVGYTDQNYFTKIFKKVTNMTPSEYRELRL